jgi:hypothetical protein
MKTLKYFTPFFILAFALQSSAGLLFNYSQLALKDLDQMNAMVMSKIKESKKTSSGKTVPLKEALQAVYSRPNEDGMIEKVVGPLRTELDELDSWEKVLNQLTVEAIGVLNHPKAFNPVVQVTYTVFLENLLIDMKPYALKEGFERSLTQKIRDAKIELSKEANNERRLRMMKSTISPSELAEQILSEPPPAPSASPAASDAPKSE